MPDNMIDPLAAHRQCGVLDQFLCRQALFLADFGIRKSRSGPTPPGTTAGRALQLRRPAPLLQPVSYSRARLRCSARSTLKSYCRVLTIYPHGVYYANAVGRYIRAVGPLWTLGKTRHKSTGVYSCDSRAERNLWKFCRSFAEMEE